MGLFPRGLAAGPLAIGLCSSFQQQPGYSAALPAALGLEASDVPLSVWPELYPIMGPAALLDYDGDGWVDMYFHQTASLFRNEHGQSFELVADLDVFMPAVVDRYGASAGDYDNDGLPDIVCEPRNDCIYILKNQGRGVFSEIASDPDLLLDPPPCGMWAETACWADVDEDDDLDLWVTGYMTPPGSSNRFFENLGPTGPGGAYRFAHRPLESGLSNPPGVSKPEGAQFTDVDGDGDVDGYACGTLYQNVSAPSSPRFVRLRSIDTGIRFGDRGDEGLTFLDHDLDGDQDLLVLYNGDQRNRLWENEGDGTFFQATEVLEAPSLGTFYGCSAEDWDQDGDLDITTDHVFRRNLLVESGERYLRLAHTVINEATASPSWGDFDRDGDPDCVIGKWRAGGRLYRNDTYGPETPSSANLSLRVRVVRDSALVARGLETEFGATVEVRPHDDPRGFVRRRFVASSHGYLQQSEYALTMALPGGPDPEEPARGVTFDLLVDFPSLPANGILRIDRTVNPVLGGLELAALAEREITVFRSGLVRIDGADHAPRTSFSHRLASTGALVLPRPGGALAEPVAAPAEGWTVGMEVDTTLAAGATRVEELVLDGQLVPSGQGRCDASVILLDVTPREAPRRVRQEELATSPRNDRSFLPLDWTLKPRRVYRVLCRVTELRASPMAGAAGAILANRGALSFANPNPCDDAPAAGSLVDPATSFLELRYRSSAPALTASKQR